MTKDTKKLLTAMAVRKAAKKPRRVELPELEAHAYIKPPSAGALLRMMQLDDGSPEQIEAVTDLVAESFVNQEGHALFTREDVLSFDPDMLVALSGALRGGGGGETDEAAGGNG